LPAGKQAGLQSALFPPGCRGSLPPPEEAPAATRAEVPRPRGTPAGGCALRIFAGHRQAHR